jgi:acyl carrier protein
LTADAQGAGGEANCFARVRAVTANCLALDESTVHPDSRFVADLGADDLDPVELIMALEKEFDVTIPGCAAESFETIRDVVRYLFG